MKKSTRAFTLIELLVAVLIISILAAVAVPQYKRAVEKSHAVQAITLLKTVGTAFNTYLLANGEMPDSFAQLDVELPADWTGTDAAYADSTFKDAHSNAEWGIIFQKSSHYNLIFASRLKGPYQGAGFVWFVKPYAYYHANQIYCAETTNDGKYPFRGNPGEFCVKFFGGTLVGTGGLRVYKMP